MNKVVISRLLICAADFQGTSLLRFNRKWPHPAVAVSTGASHRPQLPVVYKLDRRWVGV